MLEPIIEKYGDQVRTHAIEIKVDNLSGKYVFPDDAILRGKVIVGLFTVNNPDDNAYAPESDRAIISDNGLNSAYVTLMCENTEVFSQFPLRQLAITREDRRIMEVMFSKLTPTRSFVTIGKPDTPAGKIAAGESIMLHFVYLNQ